MTADLRRTLRIARRRAVKAQGLAAAIWQARRAEAALATPRPSAFASFGSRSVIVPPTRIEHPETIEIGNGVVVLEHSWLMTGPGPSTGLRIDDGVSINRFAKIVAVEHVHVGQDVIMADRVYISDVEYVPGVTDARPDDRSLSVPAPVVIGRKAFLGVGVVVKPGVTIGERAYVGASSVVCDDVPDLAVVVGNPARVIRQLDADDRAEP